VTERSEEDLVRAAQAGDESAWEEIVRRSHGPLARLLFARCRDEASSLDLVQETFLEALRSIDGLGPPYHLLGWLRRIAARRLARHALSKARRGEVALPANLFASEGGARADDIDEVRARLASLLPLYREVLRLHYLLDEPVRGVAARLALPVGTIKRRMHMGRRMMAEKRTATGSGKHEIRAVPEIRVRPRPGETLAVRLAGPLVPYGSFLEPGDAEVFDWYHYPGGLWRERTSTEVRRRIEIAGRSCVEVHVDYLSTGEGRYTFDDGAEEFLYLSPVTGGIDAVLRVSRDSKAAAIEVEEEPIADGPFPLPLMTAGTEDGDGRYEAVDLGVGGVEHGTCLRRTWATSEGRGSAAEWYFTPDGRCVLMRRYNGPGWDNHEALAHALSLSIDGVEYRLWHDTVLWGDESTAS